MSTKAVPTGTTPRIIEPEFPRTIVTVEPVEVAETSRELLISDQGIQETTILLDSKNRFINRGTHYPNKIGRLRFRSNSEVQAAEGDIIRIATRLRFTDLSPEAMNRALVHELAHRAQQERHDKKHTQGHLAILGLTTAMAYIGNRLGNSGFSQVLGTVIGAAIGYEFGYIVAPHEREARAIAGNSKRLGTVVTNAIKRH